jgi:hypothetical protein
MDTTSPTTHKEVPKINIKYQLINGVDTKIPFIKCFLSLA